MNVQLRVYQECVNYFKYIQYTSTGKIRKQTKLWEMKDGTKIRICDMEDEHLANAISFLERFARHKLHHTLMFYLGCPAPRGDMAQMAFDKEFDYWANEATWEDVVPEIYWNLTYDEERRKGMAKTFFIAGVKFHQMKHVIDDLEEGMNLELVPEPENKYDPNAVAIKHNDIMLGYVPKKFSSEISALLEIDTLKCVIKKLDSKAQPWDQCEVTIDKEEE